MKKNTQYNFNFLIVSDDVNKRGNSESRDFIQHLVHNIPKGQGRQIKVTNDTPTYNGA